MRLFNWTESFKEPLTREDILKKVQKTETLYWIQGVIGIVIVFTGLAFVVMAPPNFVKLSNLGILLSIQGCSMLAVTDISSRIKLSALRITWDNLNRTESELRKSEAMDL